MQYLAELGNRVSSTLPNGYLVDEKQATNDMVDGAAVFVAAQPRSIE